MGALNNVRVIDFGHYIAGPLTGMLLADQGADVIKVDPPSGVVCKTPANATWNRGKRSIALDLKSSVDVEIARRLIADADVVIENFRPGVMQRFGLDESVLRQTNPSLIYCALPAFAENDPRSDMPGWEGMVMAAADVFRPLAEYRDMVQVLHQQPEQRSGTPTYTSEPIASVYAAMLAAVYVAAALNVRADTGTGQRIEIPLFDALLQAIGVFALSRLPYRPITNSAFSGFDHQYQCADGRWVQLVCTVPRHGEIFLRSLGRDDLVERGMTARGLGSQPELNAELTEFLKTTFKTRTASEWASLCAELQIPGVECLSTQEWLAHPQATQSDLYVRVQDPEYGEIQQPGIQVKLSSTAGKVRSPAPELDEHRLEILQGAARQRKPVGNCEVGGGPLTGLKVLDLCIILAGPTCGRTLAELGADVIKIDDPNRGPVVYHHDINRAKRSLLLDLKTDEGKEIFWRLVEDADVIVQNFRNDVVERLGIDYETVRQKKPGIVYVSLNAYGDTGPMSGLPGYEEAVQALTGMQVRYGGSAQPIIWPYGVVNDYGTGFAGAFGALLALLVRKETGGGQEVQSALARTAGTLQSAYLQNYEGKIWDEPQGPDCLGAAPNQRLYRCEDGWVFIGARSTSEIAEQIGEANVDGIEAYLIEWCSRRNVSEVKAVLCSSHVGVQELVWMNDVVMDELVQSRGLVVCREHQKLGMLRTTGPGPWMSASEVVPGVPAPLPGADTAEILEEIGIDDLSGLIERGVVQVP